jgi:hypothetical protein
VVTRAPAYLLVLAKIISSTLKMEAICFSETSVATQQATWRHIPEDDTLHIFRLILNGKRPESLIRQKEEEESKN